MVVEIGKQKHELKFGYGALRMICEEYGYEKVSGFDALIKKLKLDKMKDPTFEQLDFVGRLVVAGIHSVDKKSSVTSDEVLDAVFSSELGISGILSELQKSLPKQKGGEKGK
ncbi:hypothetical protein [Tenacibaculum sp. nBUS_03]|uniref:hypothetical protein n=1 Tax=Tenacibaculum sp. nBUS_03 TaxID=3395320 RepID=UPI003EB84DEA